LEPASLKTREMSNFDFFIVKSETGFRPIYRWVLLINRLVFLPATVVTK
jgi:hypothetical protein